MAPTGRHRRHGTYATCRASPNAEDITSDVAMEAARKPASIGHLPAGRLETRANTGLAGRVVGNAHSTRASGHAYRQPSIYTGFRPIMANSAAQCPAMPLSKCRPSWPAFFIRSHMAPMAWCMAPATWWMCSLPRESECGGYCGERCDRGCPRTRVNRAFAGRQAGNPRQHWASGQDGRKRPFHAGFRACLPATSNLRQLQADQGKTVRRSVPPSASQNAGLSSRERSIWLSRKSKFRANLV